MKWSFSWGTAPELYDFYRFSIAGKVTVLRENLRKSSQFSGTAPNLYDFYKFSLAGKITVSKEKSINIVAIVWQLSNFYSSIKDFHPRCMTFATYSYLRWRGTLPEERP